MILPTIDLRTKLEVAAAIAVAVFVWAKEKPQAVPVAQWTQAKAAPQVASVPTETLSCKPVIVYTHDAKQNLDLPASVQAAPNEFVLSSDKVASNMHPETLTTIYDDQTGKSETLVRLDPYPWLAAENNLAVGISYGVKSGSGTVGRVSLSDDLLQLKAFHVGVESTLDTDGIAYIGMGVKYRW